MKKLPDKIKDRKLLLFPFSYSKNSFTVILGYITPSRKCQFSLHYLSILHLHLLNPDWCKNKNHQKFSQNHKLRERGIVNQLTLVGLQPLLGTLRHLSQSIVLFLLFVFVEGGK